MVTLGIGEAVRHDTEVIHLTVFPTDNYLLFRTV